MFLNPIELISESRQCTNRYKPTYLSIYLSICIYIDSAMEINPVSAYELIVQIFNYFEF